MPIQQSPIKSHCFQIMAKQSDFQRNFCVTENHIKNFIPGNSNYASISKNGIKILVVGDNHVKRIRKIDFNKEL